MDKDLATFIAKKAFRCASDLSQLIPVINKFSLDPSQYKDLKLCIAMLAGEIGNQLIEPIFDEYPDIKEEIRMAIEKFDQVI